MRLMISWISVYIFDQNTRTIMMIAIMKIRSATAPKATPLYA